MDIRKIAPRFDAAKDWTAKSRRDRQRVYVAMLLAASVATAPILSVRAAPEVSDTANKPSGDLRSRKSNCGMPRGPTRTIPQFI